MGLVLSAGMCNLQLYLRLWFHSNFPRHALVPQPDQHPPTNRNSGPDSGGGDSRSSPPSSSNDGSRSSNANRNSGRGNGGNTSRGSGGGGAGFFQGIMNGLSGIAHHGHQSTHTRQHSSSTTASGTRSPTSDSFLRATPRRSNSDPTWHSPPPSPSNPNSGPGRWNNTNSGSRNLPGGWSDELD